MIEYRSIFQQALFLASMLFVFALDVLSGYVSIDGAASDYGVALNADWVATELPPRRKS